HAPITAICFDVGYNSIGTFTRRFTAWVGASPRRLRQFSQNAREPGAGARTARGDAPGCDAEIVVHCHGVADDSRIFVGAFRAPVPIGRPEACGTARGSGAVVLRNVPPGRHYVLGAALPAHVASRRFGGLETLVGAVDPTPVQIEDRARQEVT